MKTEQVLFEKFTYGGEVMGRLADGRAIFVPFVLPGENAVVKITEEKKGFARGEVEQVLTPSPQRISPRCKHFQVCGGCHYQHLAYPDQLEIKKDVVIDQLQRIGGIENPRVNNTVPSPQPFYYRNTVQFQIDEQGNPGFQRANGRGVVAIEECHLPHKEILDLWQQIDLEQFPGLKRVHIREGEEEDLVVLLESDNYADLPSLEIDLPVSVIHLSPAGKLVMAGDDHLIMNVKDRLFHVSVDSFFQVNQKQAAHMVDLVKGYLPETGNTFIELYSGVGLFTAFLADRYQEVIAIESDESACNDFAINLDPYDHVSLYMGSAEDILPQLSNHPDAMLVDPPRAGLHRSALDAIISLGPPVLVYVSCDMATFARDTKRLLAAGYHLKEVTPVDMFPQTYHIEAVSLFEKV